MRRNLWVQSAIIAVSCASPLVGQASERAELVGKSALDGFGNAVAADGNWLVVGAPRPASGRPAGYVSIFTLGGQPDEWTEFQTLDDPADGETDRFGQEVAICGDRVAVAATGVSNSQGAVYLYEWNGSSFVLETGMPLVYSLAAGNDQFGFSMRFDGPDDLLVSAHGHNAGVVVPFQNQGAFGWTEGQAIVGNGSGEQFGRAFDVDGDLLMVGAPTYDHQGTSDAGKAYVFSRNGQAWTLVEEVMASNPCFKCMFGRAVDLEGSRALVGAENAAYVMNVNPHVELTQLVPSGSSVDQFGVSVALSGEHAIVGAKGADFGAAERGATYSFLLDWECLPNLGGRCFVEDQRLEGSHSIEYAYVGADVAIHGNRAISGSPSGNIALSGSVYVHGLDPIELCIEPTEVVAGGSVEFETFYGRPDLGPLHSRYLLILTSIGGTPVTRSFGPFPYATDHVGYLTAVIPNGTPRMVVGFQSLEIDLFGKAQICDEVFLTIK